MFCQNPDREVRCVIQAVQVRRQTLMAVGFSPNSVGFNVFRTGDAWWGEAFLRLELNRVVLTAPPGGDWFLHSTDPRFTVKWQRRSTVLYSVLRTITAFLDT